MNLLFRHSGGRLPVVQILITTLVLLCFYGLIIFPLVGIIQLLNLVQQWRQRDECAF